MKKQFQLALTAIILTSTASSTLAADGNAVFTGLVDATCAVTVGTPGTIIPNSTYNTLSSKNGGSASNVSVLAVGDVFSVSTVAPTEFSLEPTNSTGSTSFSTSYSLSGATSTGELPGTTQTPISAGLTTVAVDMTAVKSGGTFNAGNYTSLVTVRCE